MSDRIEKLENALRGIRESVEDFFDLPAASSLPAEAASILIGIRSTINQLVPEDVPEPADLTDSSSRRRLAIVVGHTKTSPGAIAVAPISAAEYPWNLDLAAKIKAVGAKRQVDVRVRLRDNIGISGAYESALKTEPEAIVELHFNSAADPATGTETLYATKESLAWATACQKEMVEVLGRTGRSNRGLKQTAPGSRGHQSCSSGKGTPVCLIEPFFGHVTSEAQLAASKKDDLAEAIIDAFLSKSAWP